ncbi:MAG TPA: D-alanyl-D-alanine carboxypeptidase family protein [Paenalcaligenes sp.]|nr:D-alanyl-D-alanine carboxypeptidase family protein [Paenalcaligenes sp.]
MKQRFHTFFKKINTTISAHHWKRTLVAFPVCVALLAPAAWAASNSTDEAAEQDTTETAVVEQPSTDFFVSQLGNVPPPTVGAKAWASYDVNSGQFISAFNIDDPIEPASITKLMTAYLVFEALENGRLQLDQEINVSENAWQTEGSRMFIDPNTQVSVDDLLQGMIVQSGNDATVALAEAIAGSEDAFVALMNEEAARQGLDNTHHQNASGLPHETHLTTVRDIVMLAANLVDRFPQYLHYYNQKEYVWNDIRQANRNRLLWLDSTVDGLKTGHTKSAGYGLVSTALRDGRRVISAVVGTSSDSARTEDSLKILNWSFQNFEDVKLYDAGESVVDARVWEGEENSVGLGLEREIWVTVPRGMGQEVKPVAHYSQPLVAPVKEGTEVGTVAFMLDDHELAEVKLETLAEVPQAGFFGRMVDKVRRMFH